MNPNHKKIVFKPSRIQRLTNPGSAVAGACLIFVSIFIVTFGLLILNDSLGVVLLSLLAAILGGVLIWSNIKYWKSPKNFPPNGYSDGDVIEIVYSEDSIFYGTQGSPLIELSNDRIWKVKKGYFGCGILITPELHYIVTPLEAVSDLTQWEKGYK